jgi:DNA (cytosine-5)-methyltransferase 3A
MRVLSLFDGISCARVALDRAGIPVESYYACEIEPNAIKVSQTRHPDIIQLGDVRTATLPTDITLLIGGSPCQDLSIGKKNRQGLQGERSGLFWEYVRVLKQVKPRWFVLENVASMPKDAKETISEALGVQPVLFDASLVSAQSRKRLFWTNISFTLPEDKGILLRDILQPDGEVEDRFVTKGGKSFCLTATYGKVGSTPKEIERSAKEKKRTLIKVGHVGNSDSQGNRVYSPEGKSVTLSANGGGLGAKTGLYKIGRDVGRRLGEDGHRKDDDKSIPITRRIELREDEKTNTLTSVTKDNLVVGDIIRKLTPIECERLQGLPDGYTEGIAMTHRYKCLGNAFNVDVVAHILKGCALSEEQSQYDQIS